MKPFWFVLILAGGWLGLQGQARWRAGQRGVGLSLCAWGACAFVIGWAGIWE
jgi:hypothetical protein